MTIYIYTPQGLVTGGVELLHQLCKELNTYQDIEAYIWYRYENSVQRAYIPDCYKKYGNEYRLGYVPPKGSILIFPESIATLLFKEDYKEYQKVLYWESVYYYEQWIPKNQYLKFPEDTIHIAQSWYAYTWLKDKTGIDAIMVTDYLNDEFMNVDLSKTRKRQILYNPKKGLDVTKKIMAELSDEKFIPIENMSVAEVKSLMEESMLYIDFGNHPGKDRIPREAAMCGCCVITNREGSAEYWEDIPILNEYKFYKCCYWEVPKFIKRTLDNYNFVKDDFYGYREIIKSEKAWFKHGVSKLVDRLREG